MQDPNIYTEIEKNKSELWNLSFRDLFYKYVRFLPLFVLSVALSLLGAYMYLRYKVPVYASAGSILIKQDEKKGLQGEKGMEIFMGGNKSQNIQSEMEILRSKPLMQRVVNRLGLQLSYSASGKIKTVHMYKYGPFLLEPLKLTDSSSSFRFKIKFINNNEFKVNDDPALYRFDKVFSNSYGQFILRKNIGTPASNDYHVQWTPTASAAAGYAGGMAVAPKSAGTGILNLGIESVNPHLAADVINTIMEEYSLYSVEQQKESSEQQLDFIEERMGSIRNTRDSLIRELTAFEHAKGLVNPDMQAEKAFEGMAEADKEIIIQRQKLFFADLIDEYLSDKKNAFEKVVVPSTLLIDDITLTEMVSGYNKAQLERKLLIDGNTPVAHPMVRELDGQIEKLRLSIRENLKNIKAAGSAVLGESKTRSGFNQGQLQALPEKLKVKQQMEAEANFYVDLYKIFSENKVQIELQKASTVSNSEILDKASPNLSPVRPRKRTIQILAIFLGLLIPALFIFASEILNDKVTTRFDVEKLTNAPILGEIGHSYAENTLVVSKNTRSMVAEQFRIIRSNLHYIIQGKEKATILVTSSFSGEGKSYVSTNIGAALSLAGKKTIILEFDIRKPKILSGLGMPKGPGMTNFLVSKTDNLAELVRPVTEYENLFVLGCGPVPPNPSELLLTAKVDELFNWLKANYDIVIIDTAPVGMVSDAMTLGKYADASLYLVRQGHTFKKQVALIDEFHRTNKLPKLSIVINDVKLKPGYGYYGYGRYGYGYGYGYGSYYEEEVPPRSFFDRLLDKLDIRKLFGKKKKRNK